MATHVLLKKSEKYHNFPVSTAHKTTKFSIENQIKPSPEQLLTSYTIDLVYKYNEYMSQYTKTIVPQNLAVDGNNIRSTVSFCGGQAPFCIPCVYGQTFSCHLC